MGPECGKTASGVVRTSAILIATGDKEPEIFRSLDEIPDPMRRLLTKSTEGENSGTIWIADQRGREEIGRAFSPSRTGPRTLPLGLVWLWTLAILLAAALFALLKHRI